jgi:hypothetical protein
MSRSSLLGIAILLLAAVLVGCSGQASQADKLMKDRIAIVNDTAAAYEKVTDKKSLTQADAEIKGLKSRVEELDKAWTALPKEVKETAEKNNQAAMDQAQERMKKAKEKAGKV